MENLGGEEELRYALNCRKVWCRDVILAAIMKSTLLLPKSLLAKPVNTEG